MLYSKLKGKMPVFALMVMMMAIFASCNPVEPLDYADDSYRTGLIGVWDYAYDEYGPITNPHYINSFAFSADGTGFYAYENEYGEWINIPFTWQSFHYNYLEIYYYTTGEVQTSYYYFDRGYLVFGNDYEYDGYALRR
ncbi:MAG: hypothetical protein ACI4AN_01310 [Muribaculaceae bacterium]